MTIKELYQWAKENNLENEQMYLLIQINDEYSSWWDTDIIDDVEVINNMVYLNHSYDCEKN